MFIFGIVLCNNTTGNECEFTVNEGLLKAASITQWVVGVLWAAVLTAFERSVRPNRVKSVVHLAWFSLAFSPTNTQDKYILHCLTLWGAFQFSQLYLPYKKHTIQCACIKIKKKASGLQLCHVYIIMNVSVWIQNMSRIHLNLVAIALFLHIIDL